MIELPGSLAPAAILLPTCHNPGLPDERSAVIGALQKPIGARPIRELVKPTDRVCIAFTDLTRATPNERIIPWLLEHLQGVVPGRHITLLNQLGTHRPNTRAELEKRGHLLSVEGPWALGRVCAVGRWDGFLRAAATPRLMQAYAAGR